MKITREVSFSWDEVKTIAEQAIMSEARTVLGPVGVGEKYDVYLNVYGNSEVSIVPIPPVILREKKTEKVEESEVTEL